MSQASRERAAVRTEETRLRRRFLITSATVTLVWAFCMVVAELLGLGAMGPAQTANNFAFFLLNLMLMPIILGWPGSFRFVAFIYVGATFALITAALWLVPNDQMRPLLFFPFVGAACLILGPVATWIAAGASMASLFAAVATGMIAASSLALSTVVLTLSITALFFNAFRSHSIAALETIAQQNVRLDAAARQDALTGLLNLRAFREAMQQQRMAQGNAPFAVAFLDLDHFKSINDRFGHAGGDAALIAVANILRATVRDRDRVARIGGEEFAVLLPHSDLGRALAITERLRVAVEGLRIDAFPDAPPITVSVGVTASEPPHATVDALLQAADLAMYEAKSEGRNRVVAAERKT